jgi:hypothetical protein
LVLSPKVGLDKAEAGRIVYRNILRLEKNGLLKRTSSKKTDKASFVKTSIFDINIFNEKKQSLCEEVDLNPDKTDSPSGDLLQNLIEKLQYYKVELLTNVGERDEYKSLCREYPQLKELLQDSYNLARENHQIIMGNVKALETTIKLKKQGQ